MKLLFKIFDNKNYKSVKTDKGFTLIELIVTMAVLALLTIGVLSAISALTKTVKSAREKTVISTLADQYMEIVRNMPYSQVGTVQGNPHGPLPDYPNAVSQTISGTIYHIYYIINYIHDSADTSSQETPSYKQAKIDIVNMSTGQITSFISNVMPQGLITNPNSGAIQVSVINSQGQPVSGATVEFRYPTTTPYTYDIFDTTASSGIATEIGLPPAVNAYRVIATKAGYSTDQTYPLTAQNPNPTHPDLTVLANQVTQLTLSIDSLSSLTINTDDQFCHALSGVNLNVSGAKLIGTNPSVYKFNQNFTSNSSGQIPLNNLEWDTYTPTLLTGQNYTVFGTSPIQKITVLPGTSQTFTMILGQVANNSLLVIVKDASTGAPLQNASVEFQKGGSQPQDYTGLTGGSVWDQSDWSGGTGFSDWSSSTPNTYYQATGNIYVNNGSGDVELQKVGGHYLINSTSTIESSSFDTGTSNSSFTTLDWSPTSQDPATSLAFQLASNNDDATWNYVGPDGTANSYYTVPGTDIGSALNNNRYIRYKAYLFTADDKKTPILSELQINYVSGCFTPGQFMFNDISPSNGDAYTLTVTLPGYQTQVINGVQISGNQNITVLMSQ